MNITKGVIKGAQKIVVYGPEGIGKTTFASQFPDPVFIDTEGSTKNMDVARMDKPTSWQMIKEQIKYIKENPTVCKSLVIDTIDWAEQLCVEDICAKHHKDGIEDFGYGNGYVYTKEEFGRFLNQLEEIVEKGIHVILVAHAQIRKFEQPDELGAYDRYELKLGKKTSSQTSPLVKEWADMVLFANYKTVSVATDKDGKKHKAQGGSRVMYTLHHPCWDAKNRHNLPEQVPFEFAQIAGIFQNVVPVVQKATEPKQTPVENAPVTETKVPEPQQQTLPVQEPVTPAKEENKIVFSESEYDGIPTALADLMRSNNVGEWDVQMVVSAKGYYPSDVRIKNYDSGFISGVLVAAWDKVYKMIVDMKAKEELPFN